MEKFLTTEEVAEILGVAPSTVRGWVELRRIPFYNLGARMPGDGSSKATVRFLASDLAAWAQRRRIEPQVRIQVNRKTA